MLIGHIYAGFLHHPCVNLCSKCKSQEDFIFKFSYELIQAEQADIIIDVPHSLCKIFIVNTEHKVCQKFFPHIQIDAGEDELIQVQNTRSTKRFIVFGES